MSSAGSKDTASAEAEPAQIGKPISHRSRALYDQDEFGWLLEQAGLLRDGRLDEIDRVSLVEFLTEMARNKKHEFRSAMTVLLHHLLKVVMQPGRMTRSWVPTIVEQQQEARLHASGHLLKPASGSTASPKTAPGPWTRRWPSCRQRRRHAAVG